MALNYASVTQLSHSGGAGSRGTSGNDVTQLLKRWRKGSREAESELMERVQGELRRLGRLVLADDPVAADATCARLMGLDPRLIFHIEEAGRFLGNMDQNRITMLAEGIPRNIEPFRVLPQFQNLQIRAQGAR